MRLKAPAGRTPARASPRSSRPTWRRRPRRRWVSLTGRKLRSNLPGHDGPGGGVIRSMTGFGAGRAQAGGETVAVELRSVNGKFCDVRAHLPRDLAALEPVIARIVKSRVARGVVDVSVRREAPGSVRGAAPRIDLLLAAAYAKALREMRTELGLA